MPLRIVEEIYTVGYDYQDEVMKTSHRKIFHYKKEAEKFIEDMKKCEYYSNFELTKI